MNMTLRHGLFGAAALCLAGVSPALHAEQPDDWVWIAAPYVWAASVGTDLNTRTAIGDGGVNFSDVIDKVDGAFEGHFEGQNEKFGLFSDLTYLGLDDSHSFQRVDTHSNLDSTLFELAGVWSPGTGRYEGVEVFAGLRYIDVELTTDFDPVNPLFEPRRFHLDDSYSDFMLGVRYIWPLGDRWRLALRGDGSTGDTDGTWNVSVVGSYRVKYGEWLFGYRYLSIDIEEDDNNVDITLSGPMAGFGFVF